jgi:hypothetical protein
VHSITLINIETGDRADEILDGLATRLNVDHIRGDDAGWVQLWLQLDEASAQEAIVSALDGTAQDWRDHVAVLRPER